MNISNYELAILIGELTGSKTTSMAYRAALAIIRDDSKPCTVDEVAEILRDAMQQPEKIVEFERSLCTAIYERYYHNESIPPLPDVGSGELK